jgi:HK97 family phage prohead protease
MAIIHKVHAEKSDGMTFVLSDETPDRAGDIITASGFDLADFNRNPIALFGHRSDWILGTWKDVRVEGKRLLGELEPAPEGISARADEIIRFVRADILKAVSVGFLPIERKMRRDKDEKFLGFTYTKQQLVEASVVAVPANPNALAVAKELKLSNEIRRLVIAKHGNSDDKPATPDHVGEYAKLMEPERWSPGEARKLKQWVQGLIKSYPENRLYRKLYRLLDEIECVRTIVAEHGRARLTG